FAPTSSREMKTAIAIFVLTALMTAPIACVIVVCPAVETHDCCPKSKTFAACPFDILASAKASMPVVIGVSFQAIVVGLSEAAMVFQASFRSDDRDLHLANRVLRI